MSGTQIETSKIVTYKALSQADERASKVVAYSVLARTDTHMSKLVTYVVLAPAVVNTGQSFLACGLI